jgi:murein DD-endopeptidase MepM/ murein hydrolase activator NlpD
MSSPNAGAGHLRHGGLAILIALVLALPCTTPADTASGATPTWRWPVPAPHTIVRPFIAPETAYSAGHRGIDIAAADRSIVTAPADGVVFFAGVVVDRPVLSITHADGLISSYEPLESTLGAGAIVHRGDAIGTLVAGHCPTSCLHLGVRLHGEYVSPLVYLGGVQRPVLLPTRPIVGR